MKNEREIIRIAILDSGVKLSHPAIQGTQVKLFRVWEDGSLSRLERDTEDNFGHGTAIFNLYRSRLSEAEISCYKVQDGYQYTDNASLLATLEYILENEQYDIINISLGTTNMCSNLYHACQEICNKGTIIIAAFDNNGAVSYPAAYPFVIGVTNSVRCRTRKQVEYIHGSVINIGAHGNYQRLAWIQPDYILMEGNSFACAHVGILVAEIISSGIRGFENVLSSLRKIAINEIGKEEKKEESIKSMLPIEKAALIPFNKEIHSIVRFSELLNFDIVDIYDYKYSPYVGAKPGHLLQTKSLSFDYPIKNIDSIEWETFDTLIIGHLEYYGKITNHEKMRIELIKMALEHKKKVYCFDETPEFEENENVYYPQVDSRCLKENLFGKLHCLNKPIIGIFGTSSKQGKYTLQLAMRKQFLKMGVRLGQIGTEPTAELFGMDYSFPIGYNSSVNLSGAESIVYVNSILADMCKKDIDIIMVGSQSNTVPYSYANLSYYPLTQINFLMATQPDVVVLCVNPYDNDDYIERTKATIENLSGAKVIALVVFPMKLRDNFSGISSSKIPLTEDERLNIIKKLQTRHGVKTFILDEIITEELCQLILKYLSE